LDDRNAEFPTVDARAMGGRCQHAYAMTIPLDRRRLRFDGVAKYDLRRGVETAYRAFGDQRYGSEVSFAPRDGSDGDEDGYLVSFVADEGTGASEVVVLDAASLEVCCRLSVPERVPHGFHACWVEAS
ncbi:MAG: carotenoid oxygenase family protein, partial [Myxococcota bacterium]